MSFLRQLTEKPWLSQSSEVEGYRDGRLFPLPLATVGVRFFLGVATVLFSLLIVAYAERLYYPDWTPLPEPWLMWANTAMLVLSSAAFQWAVVEVRGGRMDGVRIDLVAAGVFATAFLIGQLFVWRDLMALGYYVSGNPAGSFFYLVTALHGLHLIGGMVYWGLATTRVWRGAEAGDVRLGVELCAVYWHFLLLLWLVLFGLLLFT